MNKFEYFCRYMKEGNIGRTHWVISAFSAMRHEVYDPGKHVIPPRDAPILIQENAKTYPGRLFRFKEDSDEIGFLDEQTNELVSLGNLPEKHSLFGFVDEITVNQNVIPTADTEIQTCYGNLMLNWYILYIPFGKKIPFMTGSLSGGKIDDAVNAIYSRTMPKDGEERDPNLIYVDEYKHYQKNVAYLDTWSNIATPSVSIDGLSPNKEVKDYIYGKLKELGHSPTVAELAAIEEVAAKMDREVFKGTEDGNFFVNKNYDVNRKKMYYIYGLESGFGLETIVQQSLEDGIKAKDLPDYANALRAASHNRGAQTALGGVDVKRKNQIFQAVRIAAEDCGDTKGTLFTAFNKRDLEGTFIITGGKSVLLKENEIEQYIGKPIRIRSPWSCKQTAPHYCATCVGREIAMLPDGVHNTIAAVSSVIMLIFMKAMHGKSLKTTKYDRQRSFS